MGIIRKVHPTDINMIQYLYALITDLERTENKYLTFDKFMECRDSLYMYIDKCYEFSDYPKIDGFIACRRTNISEINIDDLLFHPQPYDILYSVEAFYVFKYNTEEKRHDIVKRLLDVVEIDKNDAFIAIKFFDDRGNPPCDTILKELIKHKFYLNKYDKGIHTFTKRPIVQTNFSF